MLASSAARAAASIRSFAAYPAARFSGANAAVGTRCSTASSATALPRAAPFASLSFGATGRKACSKGALATVRRGAVVMAAGGAAAGELATLGGGCFWCLEACYQRLRGVLSVESGYADGQVPNPTYKQVCNGNTGHAEVVQLRFDPSLVSFEDILKVFFTIHDPTTLNRQGNDVGTQYRSCILYHSPEQKATAEKVMAELAKEGTFSNPIVTQLRPYDASNYYTAEGYHQNYWNLNPGQGYCQFVVEPKVVKMRKQWADRLVQGA